MKLRGYERNWAQPLETGLSVLNQGEALADGLQALLGNVRPADRIDLGKIEAAVRSGQVVIVARHSLLPPPAWVA